MMHTFDGRDPADLPPVPAMCRCIVKPILVPDDPRAWIAGEVDELTVAFGAFLLHEPDLVERLLVLDDLFVDTEGDPHA